MLILGAMPVRYCAILTSTQGYMACPAGPQVITRTDGRALGVIAHLYVDPRALAVVSLSLRAKGLGGGAAGNMPLAALCQARAHRAPKKICSCVQPGLCRGRRGAALCQRRVDEASAHFVALQVALPWV